jgi:hypothetical protein
MMCAACLAHLRHSRHMPCPTHSESIIRATSPTSSEPCMLHVISFYAVLYLYLTYAICPYVCPVNSTCPAYLIVGHSRLTEFFQFSNHVVVYIVLLSPPCYRHHCVTVTTLLLSNCVTVTTLAVNILLLSPPPV